MLCYDFRQLISFFQSFIPYIFSKEIFCRMRVSSSFLEDQWVVVSLIHRPFIFSLYFAWVRVCIFFFTLFDWIEFCFLWHWGGNHYFAYERTHWFWRLVSHFDILSIEYLLCTNKYLDQDLPMYFILIWRWEVSSWTHKQHIDNICMFLFWKVEIILGRVVSSNCHFGLK